MRYGIRNHVLYLREPNAGPALHVKLLPQAIKQPIIVPVLGINHSEAAPRKVSWESAWNYNSIRTDGVESHFHIDMDDGAVAQFMPLNIRADNNYKANSWLVGSVLYGAVSIEAQDNGSATLATTPYTAQQLESHCQVWATIVDEYRWPVREPTHAFDMGIGYHRQYAEWSKYVGKTCPGDARVAQYEYMLNRIRDILNTDGKKSDKMTKVIKNIDDPLGGTFNTDGVIKTWLDNGNAAQAALWRNGQSVPEDVNEDMCAGYGPIVGPRHPQHDEYGRYMG